MSIIEFKKKKSIDSHFKRIDEAVSIIDTVMALGGSITRTMSKPYLQVGNISIEFERVLAETTIAVLFMLRSEFEAIKDIRDDIEFRNYMELVERFMLWYENGDPKTFHATTLVNPDANHGNKVTQVIFALASDRQLVVLDVFSEKGNLTSILMNKFHQDNIELRFGE